MTSASPNALFPIEILPPMRHRMAVIDSGTLLQRLSEAGITQIQIARTLNVDPSQISQLYRGKRQIKLDEAKKLVERFAIATDDTVPPISEQTARLLILHVANTLGQPLSPDDQRVQELTLDFQAFSKFARDHLPAPSPEATSGFLYARRAERPAPGRITPRPPQSR
jgi:transcriptional regulator with XRE-family HTH domain